MDWLTLSFQDWRLPEEIIQKLLHCKVLQMPEEGLRFPTIADVDHIARACDEVGAKLIVIDPLMAYMGDVNS
jgi:hypothetical protein